MPDSSDAINLSDSLDYYSMTDFTLDYMIGKKKDLNTNDLGSYSRIFNDSFNNHIYNLTLLDEKVNSIPYVNSSFHNLTNNTILKLEISKPMMVDQAKFQFSVIQRLPPNGSEKVILEFTFNQNYGIHIKKVGSVEPYFIDLNLFNSQKRVEMYISYVGKELIVSVQGLTFNDIIYK